jgi:hypothetical protein
MLDANGADTNMHPNLLIWLGVVALLAYFLIGGHKGIGAMTRALGKSNAMNAVMTAYRNGDYSTALQKTEGLRNGQEKTGEYCFLRGGTLHHLGQLDESEAILREAIRLHDDPRQKALVYNTLASVLYGSETISRGSRTSRKRRPSLARQGIQSLRNRGNLAAPGP